MINSPLTIAMMTNLYPPYVIGGNELFTHNIAEALRARGHTVHILTGQGREFPNDGYTHQVLNLELDYKDAIFLGGIPLNLRRLLQWHLFSPSAYRAVTQTLHRIQPDLVIACNLYMASAAPLLAARRYGCPVVAQPMDKWLVYNLNDIGLLVPAYTRPQRLALAGLKYGVQPLLRHFGRPHYILAVSEFIRRFHLNAGYAAAQSKAIYLGIPTERFPYRPHTFPADRPWRALFAGQLWHGKGPQVAIEAISRLRNDPTLPPVELNICGTGTKQFVVELEAQIARMGLQQQVTLRGLLPREQLAKEFAEHDLFLFCSIWDEPFSIVLQEALASGIPTIATTAGGTPEGIVDGSTGLLVPPADGPALTNAIKRLMHDPLLYESVSSHGATHAREHYTFDGFMDRLETLYQQIVVQGHRNGLLELDPQT